jgi:fimbrial chaperone protein
VGASIPVIVRQGETYATLKLVQLALQPASAGRPPTLDFQIERGGNSSVYGDISASFTPRSGAAHELGRASGVAVYLPNPLRRAALPLQLPPGLALEHGVLQLQFRERPEAGGRLLAEATLALP